MGPAVAQRQYPEYAETIGEALSIAKAAGVRDRAGLEKFFKERSKDSGERDLLDIPYEPFGDLTRETARWADIVQAPTRDPEEDYDTAIKRVRARLGNPGRGQIAPAIGRSALKLKQRREAKKVLTPEKFKQAKKAIRSGETAKLIAAGPIPVPSPEDFPGGE